MCARTSSSAAGATSPGRCSPPPGCCASPRRCSRSTPTSAWRTDSARRSPAASSSPFPIAGKDPPRYQVTGRPVPRAVLEGSAEEGRREFDLPADRPVVLVFGGSLGSTTINRSAAAAWADSDPGFTVVHITGEREFAQYSGRAAPHYRVLAWTSALGPLLAAADIVVSRAGGSVFEIAAAGKPAVLVPSPNVTADHQSLNAAHFADSAAIVVEDAELTAARLDSEVSSAPRRAGAAGGDVARPPAGSPGPTPPSGSRRRSWSSRCDGLRRPAPAHGRHRRRRDVGPRRDRLRLGRRGRRLRYGGVGVHPPARALRHPCRPRPRPRAPGGGHGRRRLVRRARRCRRGARGAGSRPRGHSPGGAPRRDGRRAALDLRRRRPREDDDDGDDRLRRDAPRLRSDLARRRRRPAARRERRPGRRRAASSPRPTSRTARARSFARGSPSSPTSSSTITTASSRSRTSTRSSRRGSRASRPTALSSWETASISTRSPRAARSASTSAPTGGSRRSRETAAARGSGCAVPSAPPVRVELGLPGRHNAQNAAGAIAALVAVGASPADAASALRDFEGAGRRFERRGSVAGAEIVDDYAHHPTEVAAAIDAARAAVPGPARRLLPAAPLLAHRGAGAAGSARRWPERTRPS